MVQNNHLVYGKSKERLESVFDLGTFVELGAYSRKKDADEFSGVVCGYGAVCGKLTYMGLYLGSPAILSEKIYMYLAEELDFGETDPDDDEFLSIERIPIKTLVDMIARGEVPDGKTQAAVLRAYYAMTEAK